VWSTSRSIPMCRMRSRMWCPHDRMLSVCQLDAQTMCSAVDGVVQAVRRLRRHVPLSSVCLRRRWHLQLQGQPTTVRRPSFCSITASVRRRTSISALAERPRDECSITNLNFQLNGYVSRSNSVHAYCERRPPITIIK